ncbi:hypothetical protein VDGD_20348 [Verticillium dahliae]|nr:hypothetical protein VDGD_20348 [Verticillium dahliae]
MLSSSDSVAWLYPHAVLLAHLPDNQSVRFQLAAAPGARAGSSASTRWPCAFTRMAPLFKSRNLRAPSRPTAAVASAAAVQGRALVSWRRRCCSSPRGRQVRGVALGRDDAAAGPRAPADGRCRQGEQRGNEPR